MNSSTLISTVRRILRNVPRSSSEWGALLPTRARRMPAGADSLAATLTSTTSYSEGRVQPSCARVSRQSSMASWMLASASSHPPDSLLFPARIPGGATAQRAPARRSGPAAARRQVGPPRGPRTLPTLPPAATRRATRRSPRTRETARSFVRSSRRSLLMRSPPCTPPYQTPARAESGRIALAMSSPRPSRQASLRRPRSSR